MNGSYWTNDEKEYLKLWYGKKLAKDIAIDINRPERGVIKKANQLGLKSDLSHILYKLPIDIKRKNQKECKKRCFIKNKAKYRTYFAKSKADKIAKNKKIIDAFAKYCSICGETNKYTLEFHHIKSRKGRKTIGYMVSNGYGKDTLIKELKKCQVLCRNCHRLQHVKNYQNMTKKIKFVHQLKQQLACSICYKTGPPLLDFHHIDELNKTDSIGMMTRSSRYLIDDIKNEILKTCVLCANCHKKIHNDPNFNPSLRPLTIYEIN